MVILVFDYIFTNAPDNEHNRRKRTMSDAVGSVVLDGGYRVDIKIASKCQVGGKDVSPMGATLLRQFSTDLLLTGGDACVPPNPLAAYGTTLACESADMVVRLLAVGYGHLNTVLSDAEEFSKGGIMDTK
jgi:2-polyprenyl-6-methoxyphenol hydroxylase-like FAD-dependent oxidoreductase